MFVYQSIEITPQEFNAIRNWLNQQAGIYLSDTKRQLVMSRLQKRLQLLGLESFSDYYHFLLQTSDQALAERKSAVNLLTTNETYFFRESHHFDFLQNHIVSQHNPKAEFSAWSAAASIGAEAYSMAMTLADSLPHSPWHLVGTDINTDVLAVAENGIYACEMLEKIPKDKVNKYCQRGVRSHSGFFRIKRELREKVRFQSANLVAENLTLQPFNVIFLRNVLMYFADSEKQLIINNMIRNLKPGGYLILGHSEGFFVKDVRLKHLHPGCFQLMTDSY